MAVIKFPGKKARESNEEYDIMDHHGQSVARLKHERGDPIQFSALYHGTGHDDHEDRAFKSHDEAMKWVHEKHYGIMPEPHEKLTKKRIKEEVDMSKTKELLEMVNDQKPYEIKGILDEILSAKAGEAIDTIKERVANSYFEPEDEDLDEDLDEEDTGVTEEELHAFLSELAEESEMSIEDVLNHMAEENDMTIEQVLEEVVAHLGEKE